MNSLNGYEIILASGSPRRKAFFNEMGLDFKNKMIPVNEDFLPDLMVLKLLVISLEKKQFHF